MPPVDLRSDTVTQPTDGMRAAIVAARVGDDRYREDPTVIELEAYAAALFGRQAALWLPTGTMANQVALHTLVPPRHELLCDADAHIVRYQAGGLAAIGGITTRTVTSPGGLLDVDGLIAMLQPTLYATPVAAIAVEQTHMRGGGTIQPVDRLRRLRAAADHAGIAIHCDGARIWHAHLADHVPLTVYGAVFDTLTACLSKGLGAPAGSMLIGDLATILAAREHRLMLGGQMRQVGILAAAGLYALRHHLPDLAADHTRAHRLATALARHGVVDPAHVRTNIVNLQVTAAGLTAADVVDRARRRDVLAVALTTDTVRLVTHRDIDDAQIDHAITVLTDVLTGTRRRRTTPAPAEHPVPQRAPTAQPAPGG